MLVGRPAAEAPGITSRVCGICAVGHTTTAVRAVEAALGIAPPPGIVELRKILLDAEFIQSHVLHVYFLVAPDLFGVGSVLPLAESHPEIVLRALRLKKMANDVCARLAGRHVHPIGYIPGGISRWPTLADLRAVRNLLAGAAADIEATVELAATLELPDFQRPTEYLALTMPGEYALYDGIVTSSEGVELPIRRYREVLAEYLVVHSTAKHARARKPSYTVGALARWNLSGHRLLPAASAAAERLRLPRPSANPFHNNLAQVVEIAQCHADAVARLDALIAAGAPAPAPPPLPARSGTGAGACEVPRGILFHEYTVSNDGLIQRANLVIPTGQNLANIEADMRARVPELRGQGADVIRHDLEMLVRAYDPCISCSTHFLEVELAGDGTGGGAGDGGGGSK
jgi:coenzyme F420-reducing hydrogenase alpha subunit